MAFVKTSVFPCGCGCVCVLGTAWVQRGGQKTSRKDDCLNLFRPILAQSPLGVSERPLSVHVLASHRVLYSARERPYAELPQLTNVGEAHNTRDVTAHHDGPCLGDYRNKCNVKIKLK